MFTKFEIAGIALCVTLMAGGLYLMTRDSSGMASVTTESQTANTGRIFVSEEGDQEANLRSAIIEAADGAGTLREIIVDDVTAGDGAEVALGDTVTVHYVGTLQNGQEFDNSNKRGEPFTFTVGDGKVIAGWEEGIIGMKEGGKRILVIPSDKGYGDAGYGPIPGGANLVFAIDLLEVQKP